VPQPGRLRIHRVDGNALLTVSDLFEAETLDASARINPVTQAARRIWFGQSQHWQRAGGHVWLGALLQA
jgi:hypothetical protein